MIVGAKSGRLDGPAQQQRSKLPGVTGSSPAPPYNTPVTDDTVVQAWRSDGKFAGLVFTPSRQAQAPVVTAGS